MWRNVVPCDQPAGQGNDFELIPTVTMESRHSVDGPTCRDFTSIYIVRELRGPEVESRSRKVAFLEKTTPYGEIFENSFRKDSLRHRSTYCVQISWTLAHWKSVKSRVVYVTKKKQKFGSLSRSRFCADRAQNLPAPGANNVLGVSQTSAKSIHFRRSYSRTCEHRSNAPWSVSNTRRNHIFFAE